MSFNRIGDRGLLISAGNPIRTLSFAAPEFPALQDGRLWAGLSGNLDYEREHLFMDVMKSAREWIGHLPAQWGGGNAYLPAVQDANGYPQSMPAELQAYSTLVLVEQPTAAASVTNGRYRFLYDVQFRPVACGDGVVDIEVLTRGHAAARAGAVEDTGNAL